MEHVWDMKQLTTKNDDYQRIRSGHIALSSGEQEEEMIRLREENIILCQQLEESHQEVRRSNIRLQETQVQLQETQAQLQETQAQLQETQVQTEV